MCAKTLRKELLKKYEYKHRMYITPYHLGIK